MRLLLNPSFCPPIVPRPVRVGAVPVSHRNYVEPEEALFYEGRSEIIPRKRKRKGTIRSQSEAPGFDIWDVQRPLFLRGKIYVLPVLSKKRKGKSFL